MQIAKVTGTVVATKKSSSLVGRALKVLQPCNEEGVSEGDFVIAIDSIGARVGDKVLWVSKREASMAIDDAKLVNDLPVDAAVTGIIDDIG